MCVPQCTLTLKTPWFTWLGYIFISDVPTPARQSVSRENAQRALVLHISGGWRGGRRGTASDQTVHMLCLRPYGFYLYGSTVWSAQAQLVPSQRARRLAVDERLDSLQTPISGLRGEAGSPLPARLKSNRRRCPLYCWRCERSPSPSKRLAESSSPQRGRAPWRGHPELRRGR